jgi:DNA modification methylase
VSAVLHGGDVRAVLATLPERSVQTCITSPPYWGLRDYGTASWEGGDADCGHTAGRGGNLANSEASTRGGGHKMVESQTVPFRGDCGKCGARRVDNQLGLERTPEEYVASMVDVFRGVRRVLRDDGTLWLNLGDSYAGSATVGRNDADRLSVGAAGGHGGGISPPRMGTSVRAVKETGLKPKDLVGIPWRVAFALQADGWYLRSEVIWGKPNPMPESVTDRPTKAHEQIFLFAKGQRVSRVVQIADVAGEVVHFGQHVSAEKSLAREPVTKFCVRLASALFDGAQRQHDFSLPPFYAEEWKQAFDGGHGELIGHHPCVGRLAAIAARLLCADTTTKGFLQEMDRLWLDLGARNALLIGGAKSLLGAPSIHVDADGSVTVHDSGEVCQFEFGHDRIVWHRPTTCNYYYDADAIKEPNSSDPETLARIGRGGERRASSKEIDCRDQGGSGRNPNNVTEFELTGRNARTVWTIATQPYSGAHFATFPEELARRCILAGSSAKACESCGAPWERVVERESSFPVSARDGHPTRYGDTETMSAKGYGMPSIRSSTTTLGWQPTCACENAGTGQSTVLDPFGGSGTTASVAVGHGRRAIHIDLNPAYLELARQRIGPMLCVDAVPEAA